MGKIQTVNAIESISSKLDWLRHLDPKIFRFDDPEVEALGKDLSDLVVDLFGHGSPEFEKFHEYRICMGPWSMKDSSSEKQMKFELGIPKAVKDLTELLEAVGSLESSGETKPSDGPSADGKVEAAPGETSRTEKKKTVPPLKAQPPVAEPQAGKTTQPSQKKTAEKPMEKPREKKPTGDSDMPPVREKTSTGTKVLLLHSGEDEMTVSVIDLLDKLGVDTIMPDASQESTAEYMGEIAGISKVSFAVYLLNPDEKTLFPGLPGKISKAKPRQDTIFELGLLVGKLGRDRVAVLFRRERGVDIPDDFFGVNYVAFDAAGGWKINLIKLLKASGFKVDANILFE